MSKNIFKKEKMHEITQKIIQYTKGKYALNYNKWHIGLTDDPKMTKKDFENKNKIVCAYFKIWPCKNKTEAKRILKEFDTTDFITCKKTPKNIIFVFLSVNRRNYKIWKILNAPRPKKIFFMID